MSALHFSSLKLMSQSPLHFRHHLDNPTVCTPAMRIGTAVHRLILGGELPPIFDGTRRGAAWEAFKARYEKPDEILSQGEMDKAINIAEGAKGHPNLIASLLGAEFEVPLEWEMNGIHCATRGIDIQLQTCHRDLKTCRTVQPDRLLRDCEQRLYHAQLAWYEIGREVKHGFKRTAPHSLVCVESSPPYDVVIVEMSDAMIESGKSACFKWFEEYCVCASSNSWPGYTNAPLIMEPRVQFEAEEDNEESDDSREEITE